MSCFRWINSASPILKFEGSVAVSCCLSPGFSSRTLHKFLFFPMLATCHANLIFLGSSPVVPFFLVFFYSFFLSSFPRCPQIYSILSVYSIYFFNIQYLIKPTNYELAQGSLLAVPVHWRILLYLYFIIIILHLINFNYVIKCLQITRLSTYILF